MNAKRTTVLTALLATLLMAVVPVSASAGSTGTPPPTPKVSTPPPVPKTTRPLVVTRAVSQKGQEKIPKQYRLAKVVMTIVPMKKPTAKAKPANFDIQCYEPYPTGFKQEVDYYGIFGINLIHFEQDIYFCWSLDTSMLYGVPQITPYANSHWGWSFVGEYTKMDWDPYPYIFHSYMLGGFNYLGQGLLFQKHVGLDAYCYWDGECHAGPHYSG